MTVLEIESQSQLSGLATVLLVGQPNVGKSALFFALTGRYATVANYPGTTIEVTRGVASLGSDGPPVEVVDTPGTGSLRARAGDESVTCALLRPPRGQRPPPRCEATGARRRDEPGGAPSPLRSNGGPRPATALRAEQAETSPAHARDGGADPGTTAAVVVADARNLRRGLALALEVGATGVPLVLAVNMIDEARARGLAIDAAALGRALGVPAVATAATTGEGVQELRSAIPRARRIAGDLAAEASPEERLRRADALLAVARAGASLPPPAPSLSDRLATGFGRAATHPVLGWPILLAVLLASYFVVGKLGAGIAVDFLQGTVFGPADGPGLNGILARALDRLGPPALLRDLLFGPYGVMTMAVTYALALILPVVGFFFVVFGFLEDTGYLPRLAVITNRAFSAIGLNGQAVLPMVLGLGCDTMATLATRILATRRERLIVALLLALAVPCSAQLAVVFGLFAVAGGPRLLLVWLGIVLGILLLTGFLAARLLPGAASDFIVELPPIRRPIAANIARKTLARIEWYLREAVPLFIAGTLALFVLDRTGALERVVRAAEPLVVGLLGLPRECAAAFVVGFLRRDYGAVYLFDAARRGALSQEQVLVATVTITLFLPCIASGFMLGRELGLKTALAVSALVFTIAFGVGGAVHAAMSL